MTPRRSFLGWSDLPYGLVVVVLVAAGFAFFSGSILNQPYATFAGCGFLMGGFLIVLGWIRARSARITYARRVPKLTARKTPKQ